LRQATIEDVAGILELIAPLEEEGVLVRRSREAIEMDIHYYTVIERDGMIIAVAALHPFVEEQAAEMACLAVHPDYRNGGRGDILLEQAEKTARQAGCRKLFALSTRTMHWFRERGFHGAGITDLPVRRKAIYNYQRNARVFIKNL
jgi:amino-acid N-acetyltransferase